MERLLVGTSFAYLRNIMPVWSHPWVLLLLAAVPPLIWLWQGRRRPALRFPSIEGLRVHNTPRSWLVQYAGAIIRGLSLAGLIIALAGPRWPDEKTRLPAEGIDLVMIVDVSGSMAERDFDWQGEGISRLDAVKRAFRLFVEGGEGPNSQKLEGRPTDQIALVTFATRPESPCPLTLSHSVLLKLLDSTKPAQIPGEMETNLSDAIALGLHRLETTSPRRQVVVLLSDGEHNVAKPQSGWTPRQAAQIAAGLHVPIYTIDAGGEMDSRLESAPGDTIHIRQEGIHTLEDIARITGGRSFRAHDTAQLLRVCQEIDRLERQEITSFHYRRYYEGSPWFGFGALAGFVLIRALEMTVWLRIP